MSDFTRSNSGISNSHLFFGADFTVYIEGGDSIGLDKVLAGSYTDKTHDMLFWNRVFSKYSDGTGKFKSVGSKSVLLQLANLIMDGKISNTYVAMDSEFDRVNKKTLTHSNILYTYGYSWENDTWSSDSIISIVDDLIAVDDDDIDQLTSSYNKFLTQASKYIWADAWLSKDKHCFFPKPKGYGKFINLPKKDLPSFNSQSASSHYHRLRLNYSTIYSFSKRSNQTKERLIYGHLLCLFSRKLIQSYLISTYDISNITDEMLKRFCISSSIKKMPTEMNKYYKSIFKK